MPQRQDRPRRGSAEYLTFLKAFPGFPTGVATVSSGVSEAAHDPKTPTQRPLRGSPALSPYRSPSYPPGTHWLERAALEETLRSCTERILAAEKKLSDLGSDPRQADRERIYHQMLGACDQVAEAMRRLPMETGALYEEDKERFEEAVHAFDRAWRRWDSAAG
jgi:hypothetical protein